MGETCSVRAEAMSDGIIVLDAQHRIVDLNSVAQRLIRHTASEVIGQPVEQVWPEWVEQGKHIRDETGGNSEVVSDQGDGQRIYDVRLSPLTDRRGRLVSQVIVLRDITEHKRAEEGLRQRNRELALLNRAGQALNSTLDPDQVLVTVLEEVRRVLNVVACSIWLIDPRTSELVCRQVTDPQSEIVRGWRLAPGQGIAGWVAQHNSNLIVPDVRSDGRHFADIDRQTGLAVRSILSVPLRVKLSVIGVLQVVDTEVGRFSDTDLALAESLAASAATAIENAHLYTTMRSYADKLVVLHQIGQAVVSVLDFSTVVHTTLTQVQRLFQAKSTSFLQFDSASGELSFVQALVGTTPIKVPVRLQPGEGIAGWALERGQPVLVEDAQSDPRLSKRVKQHLGIQRHALMAVPLMTRERTIGVIEVVGSGPGVYTRNELSTLQVVTSTVTVALENALLYSELKTLLREREETQTRLIQSAKMAAIGELAAGVAHELNNPLATILLCAELLLQDVAPGDLNREDLKTIIRQACRARDIVRNLLDFSRQTEFYQEQSNINEVTQRTLALVHQQLQNNDIAVEEHYAADLPLLLLDEGRVKQVLLNLIINAMQAMPQGGTLTVSSERVGNKVVVQIADTGVGIPAEYLSRIFDPFFTTKPVGQGTGLGLSVSLGIIEEHGGRIEVESRVGEGSTFTVWLPQTSTTPTRRRGLGGFPPSPG